MGVLNKKTNRIAVAAVAALGEAHALNFYYAFGIKTPPIKPDSLSWKLHGNSDYGPMTWNFVARMFAPNEVCTPKAKDLGSTPPTHLGKGGVGAVQSISLELWYPDGARSCVSRPVFAQKTVEANYEAMRVTKMVIKKMFLSPLSTFQQGVVPILATRTVGYNLEVVMPKAIGSLSDLLKSRIANWNLQNNPLLAQQLIQDIRGGIMFMHDKNVAHLDIKPDNILLFEEKNSQTKVLRAKLADFDFAEDLSQTTGTKSEAEAREAGRGFAGTPGYVSLELPQMARFIEMDHGDRLVSDVLKDADWWAFRCVNYEVASAIFSRQPTKLFPPVWRQSEFQRFSHEWKQIVVRKVGRDFGIE